VLVVAGILILLSVAYTYRVRTGMADFRVFYRAGQRMAAGETLYQPSDGHYMFKYFPSAAILYLPVAVLPFEAAKGVWFGLSLLALAGMFSLVADLVPERNIRVAMVLSGLILAKYFLHELRLGQTNIFAALIMYAGLRALVNRPGPAGEILAGVLTGLAIALKPYAALMLGYLVVSRHWRAVAGALATLLALLAVPTIFYGLNGNLALLREWAATLSQSTPALLTSNDNVSVIAFFTKWLGDSGRALLPAIAVLGVLGSLTVAVIIRGRRVTRAPVLDGALVLTLIVLVSPLGWDYTFLIALVGVVLILGHFTAFSRPVRWLLAANFAVIALAVYDVMGRSAYLTFMQWSVTTINFIVVVAALMYLRFTRVC
jgi:hypothetical protein